MSRRFAPLVWLLLVALPLQPALAQKLYKSTTPDGRVVYSDKPPPDAVKVEESKIDPKGNRAAPPSAGEKTILKEMEGSRKSREMTQDRVRRAEIALHDAEVALALGKEPAAGERLGTVGGNQRLTDAYYERQKKLEDNVAAARRFLDRTRASAK